MTKEEIYKELERTFIVEENYTKLLDSTKEINAQYEAAAEKLVMQDGFSDYRLTTKALIILLIALGFALPVIGPLIAIPKFIIIIGTYIDIRLMLKNIKTIDLIDAEIERLNNEIYGSNLNYENIPYHREKQLKLEEEISKIKEQQKSLVEQLGYVDKVKNINLSEEEMDRINKIMKELTEPSKCEEKEKETKIMMKKYPQI